MARNMNSNFYVMLGIGANALWGAAFIVPYALHDFPSELITIFRYFVYGVTSIAVLLLLGLGNVRISFPIFMAANVISFCGNVGYYLFLTFGIKYSGFVYPALIIGLLPVSVILFGASQDKGQSVLGLLPGIGLIVFGIVLINFLSVNDASGLTLDADHVRGIVFSLMALSLLTIYCIANARFLKSNIGISSLRWAGLLGICALLQSLLLTLFAYVFVGHDMSVFTAYSADRLIAFMLGVVFLGVFVSYVAMWLWNVSSRHISSIVAGRVLCLETIFALAYGYMLDARMPHSFELLGICLIVSGGYLVQWCAGKAGLEV
ncbi:DMT family transporter [Aquitalea sp.]|uniref:DMT family transporter n=1 Tax=Aquitalea sp. TaxID=1872623 RepID=UPI00258BE032|nr:DMT family transporter [Aquitalea sp.]